MLLSESLLEMLFNSERSEREEGDLTGSGAIGTLGKEIADSGMISAILLYGYKKKTGIAQNLPILLVTFPHNYAATYDVS